MHIKCPHSCNDLALAGHIWAYNAAVFYESVGASPSEISAYLSWIPMLGGSISVVIGGIIADRMAVRHGLNARLVVIAISLVSRKTCNEIGSAPWHPLKENLSSCITMGILVLACSKSCAQIWYRC